MAQSRANLCRCDMNEPASFQEGATREGHSLDDKYDFPKYEVSHVVIVL